MCLLKFADDCVNEERCVRNSVPKMSGWKEREREKDPFYMDNIPVPRSEQLFNISGAITLIVSLNSLLLRRIYGFLKPQISLEL